MIGSTKGVGRVTLTPPPVRDDTHWNHNTTVLLKQLIQSKLVSHDTCLMRNIVGIVVALVISLWTGSSRRSTKRGQWTTRTAPLLTHDTPPWYVMTPPLPLVYQPLGCHSHQCPQTPWLGTSVTARVALSIARVCLVPTAHTSSPPASTMTSPPVTTLTPTPQPTTPPLTAPPYLSRRPETAASEGKVSKMNTGHDYNPALASPPYDTLEESASKERGSIR